ncbi:MAG: AMP-binding protein, partial [Actinocatenispora sp.]
MSRETGAGPLLRDSPLAASSPAEQLTPTDALPLSPAQRGIWLADQVARAHTPFVIDRCWRLPGTVDPAALTAAVRHVVSRHRALRTAIVGTADGPVQRVLADVRTVVRTLAGEADLVDFFTEPWDLTRPPALRVALVPAADASGDLLALRVHHALCDGTGLAVVLQDLAGAYGEQLALGDIPDRPAAPAFDDWVRDRSARLSTPDAQEALAHWQSVYRPASARILPPGDLDPPAEPTNHAHVRTVTVSDEVTGQLDALAQRHRVSMSVLAVAAVALLLRSTTGQGDVTVGLPVSDAGEDVGELVGLTVGLAPVRVDLGRLGSLGDLLHEVRRSLIMALEHGWLPVEAVLDRSGAGGAGPPFGVIVSYLDERSTAPLRLAGLTAEPVPVPPAAAHARTGLTVVLLRDRTGIRCRLEFAADRYSQQRAARVTTWFRQALGCLVDRTDGALADFSPFGPSERAEVLTAGAGPERPVGPGVLELIGRQVDERPSAIAVVGAGSRVGYRELWQDAARVAAALSGEGVGPESRVGICLARTPAMVAALLGVWRAGAAYVPLDPAYPAERLSYILGDTAAPVVLTDRASRHRIPEAESAVRVLCVEDLAETSAAAHTAPDIAAQDSPAQDSPAQDSPVPPGSEPASDPDRLSHVIYTSGSTGRPKGVLVEHRGVANLVSWAVRAFPPAALRSVLAATSLCFDLSVFEILTPLAAGGTVVLVDDLLRLVDNPPPMPARLVNTVPSVLTALLGDAGLPAGARTVNLAGEALPRALVTRLAERGVREVRNLYAPSETTTYSTWCVVDPAADGPVPIGRPLDNTRCYVLDDRGELVGVGVTGELYLGGVGVTRGYLDRPADTAARFVPDPF